MERVDFDPRIREHLVAYAALQYLGRQTNLRFNIKPPHIDVLTLMRHKICEQHLKDKGIY